MDPSHGTGPAAARPCPRGAFPIPVPGLEGPLSQPRPGVGRELPSADTGFLWESAPRKHLGSLRGKVNERAGNALSRRVLVLWLQAPGWRGGGLRFSGQSRETLQHAARQGKSKAATWPCNPLTAGWHNQMPQIRASLWSPNPPVRACSPQASGGFSSPGGEVLGPHPHPSRVISGLLGV